MNKVNGLNASSNYLQKRVEERKIAGLTGKERQVIALVCEGLKNREIAERLSVREITVRQHLTSIFDKLSVSDRFDLIIYAYLYDLTGPPL